MRPSTAAAMGAAHTAQTALAAWALARRSAGLPVPSQPASVAGAALVAAGAGLCVTGMRRFTGVEELTGIATSGC